MEFRYVYFSTAFLNDMEVVWLCAITPEEVGRRRVGVAVFSKISYMFGILSMAVSGELAKVLGLDRGLRFASCKFGNRRRRFQFRRDRPAPRGLDTSDVPSTTRNECGTRQECGHRPAGHHHLRRLGAGWPLLGRLRARRAREPRPRTRTCMESSVWSDWV